MKRTTLLPIAAALLAVTLLAVACNSGTAPAREQVQTAEYVLAPGAEVVLRGESAAVNVRRSDSDKLKVMATLKNPEGVRFYVLPQTEPPVQQVIINSTLLPEKRVGASSEITVFVPDGMVVRVDTKDAPVDAEGVAVDDSNLVTTNGGVAVRRSKGNFTLNTTNGRLDLWEVEGTFWTQTTNGAVSFDGTISGEPQNRFLTTNGDVNILLRGSPDLSLTIRAKNGTVAAAGAEMGLDTSGATTARYGVGTNLVTVETENGNVNVSVSGD